MANKEFELSQIINAKKIADSMAFKTGTAIVQLFVVLFISIMFAQVSVGFDDLSAFTTGSYWANAGILFAEQYYIYYVFYDWLFAALTKSDERLVGGKEIIDEKGQKSVSIGLIEENEIYLQAFDENQDKLDKGLAAWNIEQKYITYQNNVKAHITKLQNKLEKYKLKNKRRKIETYNERIKYAKELYNDEDIKKDIEFVNVKNYRPMTYQDLVSDPNYSINQKGHNTLIDMKVIKRKRFIQKGAMRLLMSLIFGLFVFTAIVGGSGFWQRLGTMLFAMGIQVVFAIKDAYADNNVNIINYSLKKKALLFCTKFKLPTPDIEKIA